MITKNNFLTRIEQAEKAYDDIVKDYIKINKPVENLIEYINDLVDEINDKIEHIGEASDSFEVWNEFQDKLIEFNEGLETVKNSVNEFENLKEKFAEFTFSE